MHIVNISRIHMQTACKKTIKNIQVNTFQVNTQATLHALSSNRCQQRP